MIMMPITDVSKVDIPYKCRILIMIDNTITLAWFSVNYFGWVVPYNGEFTYTWAKKWANYFHFSTIPLRRIICAEKSFTEMLKCV